MACAAGAGIVVLQAAGVATTAQASTAPAGAAKDLTARSGMAITFTGDAPAAPAKDAQHTVVTPFSPVKKENLIDGLDLDLSPLLGEDDENDDNEPFGSILDIAEPGDGSPHGEGSILSLLGEAHGTTNDTGSGGDGGLIDIVDGGHIQGANSGGDSNPVAIGGNDQSKEGPHGDGVVAPKVATSGIDVLGLVMLGDGTNDSPIQIGQDGRHGDGSVLAIGNGGNGALPPSGHLSIPTAGDDPGALVNLGNGGDEGILANAGGDGSILNIGEGADGGVDDSADGGNGNVISVLNVVTFSPKDGKLVTLLDKDDPNNPGDKDVSAASLADGRVNADDGGLLGSGLLADGLIAIANGGDGGVNQNGEAGPGGDGSLLNLGNGGDGGLIGPGVGGDGGLIAILNGPLRKPPAVATSGGDGNILSILDIDQDVPKNSGGDGTLVTVLTGGSQDVVSELLSAVQDVVTEVVDGVGLLLDDVTHADLGDELTETIDTLVTELGGALNLGSVNTSAPSVDDPPESNGGEGGVATLLQLAPGGGKGKGAGGDGGLTNILNLEPKEQKSDGSGGDGGILNLINNPGGRDWTGASIKTSGENPGDDLVPTDPADPGPQGGSGGNGAVGNVGNGGDAQGTATGNGGSGTLVGAANGGDDKGSSSGNGGPGTGVEAGAGGDDNGAETGNAGNGGVVEASNAGNSDRGDNHGGNGNVAGVGNGGNGEAGSNGASNGSSSNGVGGATAALINAGNGGRSNGGSGNGGAGTLVDAGLGGDSGGGNSSDGTGAIANLGNGGNDDSNGGTGGGNGSAGDAARNGLINIANGGDATSDGAGSGGDGSIVEAATGGAGENDDHSGDKGSPSTQGADKSADGGLVALANGGNSAGNGDGGSAAVLGAANGGKGKHEENDNSDPGDPGDDEDNAAPGGGQGALISLFNGADNGKDHLIELGNGNKSLVDIANGGPGAGTAAGANDAPGVHIGNGGPGGNAGTENDADDPSDDGTYRDGQLVEAFNAADADNAGPHKG
ncbi:MAG TPA: hypothetical protein VMZ00_09605, partial [Sporichthya sp.]|nr:hypothetical protein [Sporichthya sp.]